MASGDASKGEGMKVFTETQEDPETIRVPGSITPLPEWPGGSCSIHFTQQLNMLCEQCSQLLCVDCYCSKHQGHRFVPVSQKEEKLRRNLKDELKEFETELDTCDSINRDLTDKVTAAQRDLGQHLTQVWDRQATAIASLKDQHELLILKLNADLAGRSSMVKQEFTSAVTAVKAWNLSVTHPLVTAADEGFKATCEGRRFIREANDRMSDTRLPELWRISDDISQMQGDLPDSTSLVSRQLQSPARFPEFPKKLGLKLIESLVFATVEDFVEEEVEEKKKNEAEDQTRTAKAKEQETRDESDNSDQVNHTKQQLKETEGVLSKKLVQSEIEESSTNLQEEKTQLVTKETEDLTKNGSDSKHVEARSTEQTLASNLNAKIRRKDNNEGTSKVSSAEKAHGTKPKVVKDTQEGVKADKNTCQPGANPSGNATTHKPAVLLSSATPSMEQIAATGKAKKVFSSKPNSQSGAEQGNEKKIAKDMRKKLKELVPTSPRSKPKGKWRGGEADKGDIAILDTERQALLGFIDDASCSTLPSFRWDLKAKPLRWSNSVDPDAVDVAFLPPQTADRLSTLVGGGPKLSLKGHAPYFTLKSMKDQVKYVHSYVFDVRGGKEKEVGNFFLPATSKLQEALECVLGFPPDCISISDYVEVDGTLKCLKWANLRKGCQVFVK